MNTSKQIIIDEGHPLFVKENMYYREFSSDYRLVRYYSRIIIQKAPSTIKDYNLMEQQISEIIKNAIRHGNRKDRNKKIMVWYNFSDDGARLIVEDEGEGFQELEKWNAFHRKKDEYFYSGDFEKMADYVSFRGEGSSDDDGGNALFAAVEYWDMGVVFNNRRNAMAVGRRISTRERRIIKSINRSATAP